MRQAKRLEGEAKNWRGRRREEEEAPKEYDTLNECRRTGSSSRRRVGKGRGGWFKKKKLKP